MENVEELKLDLEIRFKNTAGKLSQDISQKGIPGPRPLGLGWRASYWFTTYVVGLGITVDIMIYSIIIPVVPFQLQRLGYSGVSGLSGWLLFAYSGGLLISTIPIILWSERHQARKSSMILGLVFLIGSQVMFMEAPNFTVMCTARVIQGISSSVVWVVALALLCETTPPEIIGRQLGIAMTGLSLGGILAPPIGGLLYTRFGFRGPFIFALCAAVLDLVFRLLIIEPHEAQKWCLDRTARKRSEKGPDEECSNPNSATLSTDQKQPEAGTLTMAEPAPLAKPQADVRDVNDPSRPKEKPVSLLRVIKKLFKSPRACVSLAIIVLYGFIYSSQEPAFPLHLQSVWNINASRVGIIFLAVSLPMLFSSLITGWLTDIIGAEWVVNFSILLALPWWGVVTIESSLALFGVAFALESLFTSGTIAPLTAELAEISRSIEGVGYDHVYAAFNIAYAIGTTIGPVVSGQMYDHIEKGWLSVCMVAVGLLFVSVLLAMVYVGKRPLWTRMRCLHT